MNIEHTGLIKNRIRQSDVWISGKSHENGRYINGLRCPSCGESDAYLYIATPWTICCNRLNHCRAKTPIRDIFRDLYDEIEQCYPPVESDRHRPARVYLQARGLNKCLDGLRFEYWVDERSGNGAVMFLVRSYIDPDKTAWNGRFISERSPKKSHNQGATSGMFWHHPGRELDLTREVFFTESILDALSLIEHGRQAIAVLSAGASPSSFELPQFQKITLAFDADIAGRGALRRWKEAYPNASALEPPKEGIKDWNDWFLSVGKDHSKADAKFEEKRPEMEWRARLALAKTAREYAEIFYTR